MLEVRGLTKQYSGLLAVNKVSFTVNRGEVVGYLGPNGSGKSTTVNMVVGLIEPSAGSILLDGRSQSEDGIAYKQRIGYVPEEPYLYTHLTADEYLTLVGRLRSIPHARLRRRLAGIIMVSFERELVWLLNGFHLPGWWSISWLNTYLLPAASSVPLATIRFRAADCRQRHLETNKRYSAQHRLKSRVRILFPPQAPNLGSVAV